MLRVAQGQGGATTRIPPPPSATATADLTLRGAGCTVVRYTWRQVTREPERVVGDPRSLLAR